MRIGAEVLLLHFFLLLFQLTEKTIWRDAALSPFIPTMHWGYYYYHIFIVAALVSGSRQDLEL
ncbi:hypothetical protein P154DRAFT_517788 [Amniculicola lignicola CBS 123094]|uniref:Uncharacterized protein n=1 Tax=Amniculicola lignicola CBS 123094 TaxID=1392246 RepID=A0A6A5X1F4_9PLEO|nr:hypothetical protein P154DRAFT_517788 [Amniculicola lignicola CBS 123094]